MNTARSCLYEGRVRHRRFLPVDHRFEYRLLMAYLDLDELDGVFAGRWFWSTRRPAPIRFRRADHFGDPTRPLADAVRDLVEERTGARPAGSVRLLTHLRHFGYVMNPVSFYYVFDGDRVSFVVAEVHNTPWGETHCYVHDCRGQQGSDSFSFTGAKRFHVSPFMEMDHEYRWRLTVPGERLAVDVANHRQGKQVFQAGLSLVRRPLEGRVLASSLLRFPLMTAKVVSAIYYQALRLWLKGVPFRAHPKHAAAATLEERS